MMNRRILMVLIEIPLAVMLVVQVAADDVAGTTWMSPDGHTYTFSAGQRFDFIGGSSDWVPQVGTWAAAVDNSAVNFNFRAIAREDGEVYSDYEYHGEIHDGRMECTWKETAYGWSATTQSRGASEGSVSLRRAFVIPSWVPRDLGGQTYYFLHFANTYTFPIIVTVEQLNDDGEKVIQSITIEGYDTANGHPGYGEISLGATNPDSNKYEWSSKDARTNEYVDSWAR